MEVAEEAVEVSGRRKGKARKRLDWPPDTSRGLSQGCISWTSAAIPQAKLALHFRNAQSNIYLQATKTLKEKSNSG